MCALWLWEGFAGPFESKGSGTAPYGCTHGLGVTIKGVLGTLCGMSELYLVCIEETEQGQPDGHNSQNLINKKLGQVIGGGVIDDGHSEHHSTLQP